MGGRGASKGIPGGWKQHEITYKSENGMVITEKGRIEYSETNKQEREKYKKEFEMCKDLADYGHEVFQLDDRKLSDGSYDILLDGRKADLKSLKGANNIVREGKSAIQKQGADLVVFKFEKITPNVHAEINKLSTKDIHGYYYETGKGALHKF